MNTFPKLLILATFLPLIAERSEAIRCFICSTTLDGDKCKNDQIANHNESSTANCAYCQKTEAKVWTTETVIRSCAQECGNVGTHLVRTGYEWSTTLAAFVHCCNDKDLCNTAPRQDYELIVSFLALSTCLAFYMN